MISHVVGIMLDFSHRNGLLTEHEQLRAAVALEEALVNAVIHGNLDVPSCLRDLDDGSYERLIDARLQKAPYRSRLVEIVVRYTASEVFFIIRDEGVGFDVSSVPDPTDDTLSIRTHGRGLLLMRTFADKVIYNSSGNQVTLIKRRNLPCQE
jgi:anti-sigma regulatory factor (Ser/Thr protein kinase)